MRIKAILLLLILVIPSIVSADGTTLVVSQKDGSISTFSLFDKPEITFIDEYCKFVNQSEEIWIKRKDIMDFRFEVPYASIETVSSPNVIHTEFIGNNTIRILGVEPHRIKVFDIGGKIAPAEISGTKESITLSLQQLPQGIYIVNYSGYSVKIMKQ